MAQDSPRFQKVAKRVDVLGDPDRRTMRWIGLFLAIVAAVSAILGIAARAPGTTQEWCQDLGWCNEPQRHYAIEDYLTKHPQSSPAKRSADFTIVGIGEGMTPTQINGMFPPDVLHTVGADDKGWHSETWEWRGIEISVGVQTVTGSTRDPSIIRNQDSPYYVSAPHGLLLGKSTIQDAVRAYGHPLDMTLFIEGIEMHPFYRVDFDFGAEGIYTAQFSAARLPGDHTTDPPFTYGQPACASILDSYSATLADNVNQGSDNPDYKPHWESCFPT